MEAPDKRLFVTSLESPVLPKDFREGWELLTSDERNYAYYFHRASWAGALICLHEVSYESPVLFCLSQFYFGGRSWTENENAALKVEGVTQEDFKKFVAYWAGFLSNLGNYSSFGHKKLVPDLESDKFKAILSSCPHFAEFEDYFGESFETVWASIEKEVCSYTSPYGIISFPYTGGTSAYYSSNITEKDLQMIERFHKEKSLSTLNTRVFKQVTEDKTEFLISTASIEKSEETHQFEGNTIKIQKGEFSTYLSSVNKYLQKAKNYARSEIQTGMIDDYINHFLTGDVDLHIESQKKWIKDKNPPIETNIGFIETYLEPMNTRAYFEGFVAIVNKKRSEKYANLVANSMKLMDLMPWDSEYNIDVFKAPDFTSLDIISFGSNSTPLGINIPNYDDVRMNFGFKNVYLANCIPKLTFKTLQFMNQSDMELIVKHFMLSSDLHTALHELIGHGSGKLFFEDENGNLTFDVEKTKNMLTGEKITSWYKHKETWNNTFGKVSTSFEECRADTSAIYLGYEPLAYHIFGIKDEEIHDVMRAEICMFLRKGTIGLKLYDAEHKKWGQAHCQGAFVWVNYLFTNQDPNKKVIDFILNEDETDFELWVTKDLFPTEGRRLTGELLKTLQQYKSTADVENGTKFYNKYSEVNEFFLKIRTIVNKNPKPRRLDMNWNLIKYSENRIEPQTFEATHRGIVDTMSVLWEESSRSLVHNMMTEWRKYSHMIKR